MKNKTYHSSDCLLAARLSYAVYYDDSSKAWVHCIQLFDYFFEPFSKDH